MSTLKCLKCLKQCVYKRRPRDDEIFGTACDCCKEVWCKECARISATEIDAIALTQRMLLFYCIDCKSNLKQLPKIANIIELNDKLKHQSKQKDMYISEMKVEYDERIQELQSEIDSLTDENKGKDIHIARLKRRTVEFEDSVFGTEKDYVDQIDRQKSEITGLKKEILQLLDKNSSLLQNIEDLEAKLLKLSGDLDEISLVRNNMLISIEALTKDNEVYVSQLKQAKLELFNLKEGREAVTKKYSADKGTQTCIKNNVVSASIIKESQKPPKARVLILTDDFGKKILQPLLHLLGNEFCIQVICKPYARFKHVVSSIGRSLSDFTDSDFVIVLAGLNDVNIHINDITSLANKCFYTNLILGTIPVINDTSDLSYRVQGVNNQIRKITSNLKYFSSNIEILDLRDRFLFRDYQVNSFYLNRLGLRKLAKQIKNSIINFNSRKLISNLKQVQVTELTSEKTVDLQHIPVAQSDTQSVPCSTESGVLVDQDSFLE